MATHIRVRIHARARVLEYVRVASMCAIRVHTWVCQCFFARNHCFAASCPDDRTIICFAFMAYILSKPYMANSANFKHIGLGLRKGGSILPTPSSALPRFHARLKCV